MHPTYLSGIERGARNLTWEKLTALSRALDVPITLIASNAEREAQLAEKVAQAQRELGMAA
jgi:transcriptional regulator with XRE-family HTH domain